MQMSKNVNNDVSMNPPIDGYLGSDRERNALRLSSERFPFSDFFKGGFLSGFSRKLKK